MKQMVFKNVWLRVCMIVAVVTTAFAGTAWADDVSYKIVNFANTTNSQSVTYYGATWTATMNTGFKVSLTNFANNVSGYATCGSDKSAGKATITTATAIDKPISKVAITIDIDASKIADLNSIKLWSSADYVNWVEEYTFSNPATGTLEATISSPTAKRFYKVEVDYKKVKGGGWIKISQIEYFRYHDPSVVEAPVISGDATFDSSTSVTIACPTDGATIQYSTDGGTNWHTYTAAFTLTETTTVKAKAVVEGLTDSPIASKSFCLAADIVPATWNLKALPTGDNDDNHATWTEHEEDNVLVPTNAVMSLLKGSSSSAKINSVNNYSGTTFKEGQVLQFAPVDGYAIVSVTITSAQNGRLLAYSENWDNAEASISDNGSGTKLTVTPIDGTLPFSVRMSKTSNDPSAVAVDVECSPTSSPYVASPEEVDVTSAAGSDVIEVEYNRIDLTTVTPVLQICDADGNTATYNWFTAAFDADYNVAYTVAANDGAARTAYVKVSATVTIRGEEVTLTSFTAVTQEAAGSVEPITVTIGTAEYATFVAPTNLSLPEGIIAMIVTGASASSVAIEEISDIPAGTAVVLNGDPDTYTFTEIASATSDVTGNLLKASDGTITGAANIFCLANKAEYGVGFYAVASTVTIPAGKAYLEVPTGEVKAFLGFDEDDATGIQAIDNGQWTMDNAIYNVAGQRLQKMQKGINIINGKKILK